MKNIIILLTIISVFYINAQTSCGTIMAPPSVYINPNARMQDAIANWADFVPNFNTPEKTIRINFHFLLRNDGTGNFTETTNGNGNTNYNGYKYIEDLLPALTNRINNRPVFNVQIGSGVRNLPLKFNIIVDGIYFHRNTTIYNTYNTNCDINTSCGVVLDDLANNTFNVNTLTSINVYLIESGRRGVGAGVATQDTRVKSIKLYGSWLSYNRTLTNPEEWWYFDLNAYTFLHELGHCLSLWHVPAPSCGSDDYCDDTPTNVCVGTWNCPETSTTCSNNVMSYTNGNGLSPCQLGRIHWTLENEIPENKLCRFQNNTLNVTDFAMPQILYQARQISSNAILQNNEWATMVGETEVNLNPGFEVQLGATFEAKTTPSCP